jgi:hypothetical protein
VIKDGGRELDFLTRLIIFRISGGNGRRQRRRRIVDIELAIAEPIVGRGMHVRALGGTTDDEKRGKQIRSRSDFDWDFEDSLILVDHE